MGCEHVEVPPVWHSLPRHNFRAWWGEEAASCPQVTRRVLKAGEGRLKWGASTNGSSSDGNGYATNYRTQQYTPAPLSTSLFRLSCFTIEP